METIGTRLRLLIPVLLATTAKLVTAGWILERPFKEGRAYWNVFLSWDSAGYLALAQSWYPAWDTVSNKQLYAFLPAWPALIKGSYYVFHDWLLAAAVPALVLGLGSVTIFQLIAELYLTKREALAATLIFAFFPYVFLFTSVAYTESLFLFSTLACWLMHKKQHPFLSAFFAAIATLTRVYGILMIIPVAWDLLLSHRMKNLLPQVLPVASLAGWGYFCYLRTGDWFAPLTSQRIVWGTRGFAETYLQGVLTGGLRGLTLGIDAAMIPFLAICGILVFWSLKVDTALGIYSTSLFALLIYTGNLDSMVRFISFIFPIWLTLPVKDLRVALACIPIFLAVSAALWYEFTMLLWVA